jgi:hypothetical protein
MDCLQSIKLEFNFPRYWKIGEYEPRLSKKDVEFVRSVVDFLKTLYKTEWSISNTESNSYFSITFNSLKDFIAYQEYLLLNKLTSL